MIALGYTCRYEHTHVNVTEALLLMDGHGYTCSYYQMVDTLCVLEAPASAAWKWKNHKEKTKEKSSSNIKRSSFLTHFEVMSSTKAPLPPLSIDSNGMAIENQIVAYCSEMRVPEKDCDKLLSRLLREENLER